MNRKIILRRFIFAFAFCSSLANGQHLQKEILAQGSGIPVNPQDSVKISYILTINNDIIEKQSGISFVMEEKKLLPGIYNGLLGATKGARFSMVVPPGLAYGKKPEGIIPANSTLKYEIEVLEVTPSTKDPSDFPGSH